MSILFSFLSLSCNSDASAAIFMAYHAQVCENIRDDGGIITNLLCFSDRNRSHSKEYICGRITTHTWMNIPIITHTVKNGLHLNTLTILFLDFLLTDTASGKCLANLTIPMGMISMSPIKL